MALRVYIIYTIAVLSYSIFRILYKYKTNQYDPNPFVKEQDRKQQRIINVLSVPIYIVPCFLLKKIEAFFVLFIVFAVFQFAQIATITILNCKVFKKSKEKGIIRKTVVFDLLMMTITACIWLYVR